MGFLPDRFKVVLRHMLERNATEFPDNESAVFENGERWIYRQTLKEAYQAANALSELGVKRGENVLIFLPNGQDWLRAWMGINTLGAIIVPVNTSYLGGMLKHICLDSQAEYIIAAPDLARRIEDLGLELKIIDPSILIVGSAEEPKLDNPIEPWDTFAILYTSGTTGPSKGVIVPYLNIYSIGQFFGQFATQEDTFLVDLPMFHAGGLSFVIGIWSVGGKVALRKVFTGTRYWDVIRECGATISSMVGMIPSFLWNSPPKPDDADNPLRITVPGPMVPDPEGFVKRFGLERLMTGFNMTELPLAIVDYGPIRNPKSCGKIREGYEVRLVDEHDVPVPIGEVGEMIVRADLPWAISPGYWRQPELTAKAWRNGWFHTGDLFTCDEEGYYYFTDRKKDALRRRGENISSFEVEREVLAHPDVLEAACVAAPSEYVSKFGEDEVKIFVVPKEGAELNPVDLIRFLIPRMPFFMIPRFIEVIPELSKTATMRIMKYELRARGNSSATWEREAAGIIITKESQKSKLKG